MSTQLPTAAEMARDQYYAACKARDKAREHYRLACQACADARVEWELMNKIRPGYRPPARAGGLTIPTEGESEPEEERP